MPAPASASALLLALALLPAVASADLYLCYRQGRLTTRDQPASGCTRLLVAPQQDGPSAPADERTYTSNDTNASTDTNARTETGASGTEVEAEAEPGPQPAAADARRPPVRAIQRRLRALGYRPGPVDGVAGPRTREAIRAYQRDVGLAADGEPNVALWRRLRGRTPD